MGVQPLNEGGPAKPVAAGRAILVSNNRNEKPGDCPLLDEVGVGGAVTGLHLSPDRARVPRVLPRGANCVIAEHLGIRVHLKRVGTEVVGSELLTLLIEQRSLGCEEYKPDARACRYADVVLGAHGMAYKEEFVPCGYLNIARHGWRCAIVSISWSR